MLGMDGTAVTADLGASATGGLTMGRDIAGTGWSKIDLAEIVVWPSALTPTQRTDERANLKAAHGI
ncbi:hypothetical protein [Arthrobacter humicola]|uniref:hypothetical protein n=1 Tax=Arthrobacter humicola TaxID=409291 RepID=UPI001FAE218B|nr:hypothetical protein [Arthrobacter humicola]MCI9872642.1 hypothetical protein [Arthrobacter humicola]